MIDLNSIKSPADIKNYNIKQLGELCTELRKVLLDKLAVRGGHVAPNLGFLEATVALHYVFDAPRDKIVYDVSHQTYVHKMLTGRMQAFTDPAHYKDVTGYTNPRESIYDLFELGHTSTAASLAAGLAKARDIEGGTENVIAVVGDGALSGGVEFEGLDYGATLDSNFIVVFNDNQMSIAENHGGIYDGLANLRETNGTGEPNYFKSLGYEYVFVKYGNDIESLVNAFRAVKDSHKPVVVHIDTQKGMGYDPAEADREAFHWHVPFDLATGDPRRIDESLSWDDVLYNALWPLMQENKRVVAITAGTPDSIGFTPERRKLAGKQFIDVGIAEQNAVAMSSGLAKGGLRPVFGVVSSFLQRAYDQLEQDVAINNQPAAFVVIDTGIESMNDVTHLGWFDIALIGNIPNFVYLAPTCMEEYQAMIRWAVAQTDYPVAVRQPAGPVWVTGREYAADYSKLNKSQVFRRGKGVAVIAVGSTFRAAYEALPLVKEKGLDITLINPVFVSGLDTELLDDLRRDHSVVITLEDGVLEGGFGEKVAAYYGDTGMKVISRGIPKKFLDGYNPSKLLDECGLTPARIAETVINN